MVHRKLEGKVPNVTSDKVIFEKSQIVLGVSPNGTVVLHDKKQCQIQLLRTTGPKSFQEIGFYKMDFAHAIGFHNGEIYISSIVGGITVLDETTAQFRRKFQTSGMAGLLGRIEILDASGEFFAHGLDRQTLYQIKNGKATIVRHLTGSCSYDASVKHLWYLANDGSELYIEELHESTQRHIEPAAIFSDGFYSHFVVDIHGKKRILAVDDMPAKVVLMDVSKQEMFQVARDDNIFRFTRGPWWVLDDNSIVGLIKC